MAKKPLYAVIYDDIKKGVLSGKIQPDSRLSTEKEIARQYNVSRITATRALKELELGGLIRRVKGSGSYVNSREHWEPGNIKSDIKHNTGIVSLVLPFDRSFSYEFLSAIEKVAKQNRCFVTFHNSAHNPEIEREIIDEIIRKGSAGFIIYPTLGRDNMDLFSNLMIRNFPFVVIDRMIPGLETPLVYADNRKGFFDLTSHLIELGHERIIFVGSTVFDISSELDRYTGFCKAHLEHGLALLPKHLFGVSDINRIPADYRPGVPSFERECHFLFDRLEESPIRERPTAIAAVNDYIAEHILRTALIRGIKVPQTYSITGFDDLPSSAQLEVPLTTVSQPVYEIGRIAAEELFKRIKAPGTEATVRTAKSSLVPRESTCPPIPG